MARLTLHPIGCDLSLVVSSDEATRFSTHMTALDQSVQKKIQITRMGWGAKYVERVHEKGKLTTWERISELRDPNTDVFEVGTLVNWGRKFDGSKLDAPGAGVVTVFVKIAGRWTMVIANENTVASGAWWPQTPEKIERAQQMALRLHLPVVYLVDCSGLFLPEQSRSFAGATGAGHIFKQNSLLAAQGVPQIAGVFGDCIAGGGYMPIISDRVVMTESAYMVIAGAALIRGAKSLKLTSLDIGGPEVHVHQSVCADVRVPNDATALRFIRNEIGKLPTPATEFYRYGAESSEPRYSPTELSSLFPSDSRQSYDIEQVIARLIDSSVWHEVLPQTGREIITGIARISGLWVGIIANRQGLIDEPGIGRRAGGALYREGIAKMSAFSRACNDDGIPMLWLQDISGFDIGVEAERLGLLSYGSNLIYSNSTHQVPMFTVLLRKASGAGYYAMAGLPYDPVVQLSTPMTRLAVMEGRTLAIATYNSKLDDNFEIATQDEHEKVSIEAGMREVASRIDADMDPVAAASRMDTDEIVPVSELRSWLACLVESAWQSMGARRTKNPRIWSLFDLQVLGRSEHWARFELPLHGKAGEPTDTAPAGTITSPTVGTWTPWVRLGASIRPGDPIGRLERLGQPQPVLAPEGVSGMVAAILPLGAEVECGESLISLTIGELGTLSPQRDVSISESMGANITVIRAETDGTIYLSPDPASPTFVSIGEQIESRTTIGLIEVMKTFTPVRAAVSGTVTKVLVTHGVSVTQGMPLFWIQT